MAKNATKQGKTTTIDPVGITVGLLAHADCEAASALGSLGQALLVPVTEPKFTPCTFLVGETEYCPISRPASARPSRRSCKRKATC